MATIGSIVDGGRSLVVGLIPGRSGAPERLVARPIAGQTGNAENGKAQDGKVQDGKVQDGKDSAQPKGPGQLSPAERREVAELQERDREVRNDEERHKAAAGKFAGPPEYVYRRGPDGKLYAVEGKVPINVNVTGTADQRTAALRRVQAAAVSVQSPSSGDFTAVGAAAAAAVTTQGQDRPRDAEQRRAAQRAYSDAAAGIAKDLLDLIV